MIISDDELQECVSLLANPVRPTVGARQALMQRIEKRVRELQEGAWLEGSLAGWHDRTRSFLDAAKGLPEPVGTLNPYRAEATT